MSLCLKPDELPTDPKAIFDPGRSRLSHR